MATAIRAGRYKTQVASCGRCQKKDHLRRTCRYTPSSTGDALATEDRSHAFIAASNLTPSNDNSTASPTAQLPDARENRPLYGGVEPHVFACKINEAINARLGIPMAKNRCPMPLLDAPLFGDDLPRRPPVQHIDGASIHSDNVLPPRRHADHLVSLYWQRLDSLDPLLEQDRFSTSYELLFTGGELDCDERIFVSTLNAIFALSTQLQEFSSPHQRNEASKTFFQRAWTLLRPDTIVWGPSSVELVQCLLLLARYLECTRNLQHTWMAIGSAVRIAQSLGLHIQDKCPSTDPVNQDIRLRRRVWNYCAWLDRKLSWTLGRPSLVPATVSTRGPYSTHNADHAVYATDTSYETKTMELSEIIIHITFLQASAQSSVAERLGLPPLLLTADLKTTMQVDECLTRFVKTLPSSLSVETTSDGTNGELSAQPILLHIRILHARIILFRPMFSRFCLPQSSITGPSTTAGHGLESRVVQDGATMCVENAQRMITLLSNSHRTDAASAILPWWYRVFYTYIASQILIAAMLRADIFKAMVLNHWSKAMSMLQAHEHLCPAVARFHASFQSMWQQVSDLRNPGGGDQGFAADAFSATNFQDLFQHLGFEQGDDLFFNFGVDNSSAMSHLDWEPPG
ncbi:Sorbicillinoid biosynthetic cluster transcription factor 2 [Exophiala dermatitidis]